MWLEMWICLFNVPTPAIQAFVPTVPESQYKPKEARGKFLFSSHFLSRDSGKVEKIPLSRMLWSANLILFNTQFLVFDTSLLLFDTLFVVFDTKFIIFTH